MSPTGDSGKDKLHLNRKDAQQSLFKHMEGKGVQEKPSKLYLKNFNDISDIIIITHTGDINTHILSSDVPLQHLIQLSAGR